MANKGDEHQEPQPGEVIEPAETDEDDKLATAEEASESPDDSGGSPEGGAEGQLGDEEAIMPDNAPSQSKPRRTKRPFAGYWRHKAWTMPLTLLAIVGILFAVPATRYGILGHFWRKEISFVVLDAQTHKPVSTAAIELQHSSYYQRGVFVDSQGKATVDMPVGRADITITKRYYKTQKETIFVPLRKPGVNTIYLMATGRQVPVKVVNKITGQPISDAVVSAAGTSSQTGADGTATVVLPADKATVPATIAPLGTDYNKAEVTIQVSTHPGDSDTFQLTPSGHVYFLSNLSGNIDVVSTNLDGTGRKTVLAGTGNEDPSGTLLRASSDWHYLVLLSKRDANKYPMLYLIDTTDNSATTMDSTDGPYTLIGWSGHRFVYQVGHLIKSFNADSGNTVTLVNAAVANSSGEFQAIWDAVIDRGKLFYDMTWYQTPGYLLVTGKQNTLGVVNVDGTNGKVLKSVDAGKYYFSNLELYKPGLLYLGVYASSGTGNITYYHIDANENVVQDNTVTVNTLAQTPPSYLLSPSGNSAFWSQQRDGKNTLFVGDADGSNGQQIASLSDYAPYGWYTDKYLLVEKNGSELGIMPVAGGNILKVSDYYKPPSNGLGGN